MSRAAQRELAEIRRILAEQSALLLQVIALLDTIAKKEK
jgi:hypothetical protein